MRPVTSWLLALALLASAKLAQAQPIPPPDENTKSCTNHWSDGETPKDLARVEKELLAAPAPQSSSAPEQAWDKRLPVQFLDLVDGRFHLTSAEKERLTQDGMVVAARLDWADYANAFHEIHQSQVPIYVSMDSVLHAIFKGNDWLIQHMEEQLSGNLKDALTAMHEGLLAAARDYPEETVADLDLYLTVARGLLEHACDGVAPDACLEEIEQDQAIKPVRPETKAQARELLAAAFKAEDMNEVTLFGRERLIDFTTYRPRGHYVGGLEAYFRGASWLSRLEFNLVSHSCRSSQPGDAPDPSETPREAVDALALVDLAGRSKALEGLDRVASVWTALAGKREDVSVSQLADLRKRAGIASLKDPDVQERLAKVIGDGFHRTARTHPMPQGSTHLPVIATVLGPRVGADVALAHLLVNGQVPDRYELGTPEIAYAFGSDRALNYLQDDLRKFPSLKGQLEKARELAKGTRAGRDLYSNWLVAIRGLGQRPEGALPSFMATDAFADLRVNSLVAAYGQLRHNFVLMAAQEYEEGGCEIPDGYVEPAPAVYDALLAYVERAKTADRLIGDDATAMSYLKHLDTTLRVLRDIGAEELAGHALSEPARDFLAMAVEVGVRRGGIYGMECLAQYQGWYFDLFPTTELAFEPADFIADYFRSSNTGRVTYAGARGPRLGFFVVDTGGAPRLMVGPVARAFEMHRPGRRLTDQEARAKLGPGQWSEPWAHSYTVVSAPAPAIVITCPKATAEKACTVAGNAGSPVTLSRIDYHGRTVNSITLPVSTTPTRFVFTGEVDHAREMLQVSCGDFRAEIAMSSLWHRSTTAKLGK
jgi:hypothetical protein